MKSYMCYITYRIDKKRNPLYGMHEKDELQLCLVSGYLAIWYLKTSIPKKDAKAVEEKKYITIEG